MCGIAGYFGKKTFRLKEIKTILSVMKNRGPDSSKYLHFKIQNKNLYLFHTRLKVIDLYDRSNQPLEKHNKIIIYNGEIYNFKELKVKFNLTTKSNSDTEILLELFVKLNLDCLKLLNGIFAFIIFDNIEKKVYCVRDRLGVKPLYFLNTGSSYYFCSEIKGLLNVTNNVSINYDTVQMYLSSSFYDYSPQSFYKQITQVEQSTCLIFDTKKNENFEIL